MSLLVPNGGEVIALSAFLNRTMFLGLYANDLVPAEGTTFGSLTEASGGGYARLPLTFANFDITSGNPCVALYDTAQDFLFTGPTDAPGTLYGYFVVDGSDNLLWLERFSESVLPFSPALNTLIRITPRLELS